MKNQITIKTAIFLGLIILLGMRTIDGGDCLRIYGEFELNNGDVVKGYTHSGRLDFENAKKDFKRFLHYSYRNVKIRNSITIYENIDTLKSIGIKGNRENCDFFFLASPIEKVRVISFNDWNNGEAKYKYPCETCNQKEYPYSAGGYNPLIITELDKREIEKLKGKAKLNSCAINTGELTTIYLVSLTDEYSEENLKRIYKETSGELNYMELKENLKKMEISMFKIQSEP